MPIDGTVFWLVLVVFGSIGLALEHRDRLRERARERDQRLRDWIMRDLPEPPPPTDVSELERG